MEKIIKKAERDSVFAFRLILMMTLALINYPSYGMNKATRGLDIVVIDAGHGGKDPGAVVGKAREKDIVLGIALDLGRRIKEQLPDVKVIYTRSTDVFIPLFERSVIANKNNADLFISIHANYCPSPSIKGTETYVLGLHRTEDNLNVAKKENSVILLEKDYSTRYEGFDPNLSESYIMFELIQDTHLEQSVSFAGILQETFLKHAQRASRDVRQAGFLVLRETAMPGVLIETGYLSNTSEASYLMSSSGRETLALSIFNSFKEYKERFESRLNLASGTTKKEVRESGYSSDNTLSQQDDVKRDTAVKKLTTPEKTNDNTENKVVNPQKTDDYEITFAIQLSAYPKKLSPESKIFKGIRDIREVRAGNYFKYYCLETASLTKAKINLSTVKKKIPDAFIIALKNGQPIPMKEALSGR